MKSFKHINARTVDEACTLLKKYKGKAMLNAGGTDLLSTLKGEYLSDYPEAVINIKTISGLDTIKEESGVLKIGALTKLSDIAKSPLLKRCCKALVEAVRSVATPQIRNTATIICVRTCAVGTIDTPIRSADRSCAYVRVGRSVTPWPGIIGIIPYLVPLVSLFIHVLQIARPIPIYPRI